MKQPRVLVVDDEPHLAEALCRSLALVMGPECVAESFVCGESALVRLSETQFDVLVTDMWLPGMDGLELIQQAKSLRPGTPLRALLITAYASPQMEAIGLEVADAYLPKPFNLDVFIHTVQDLLDAGGGRTAASG